MWSGSVRSNFFKTVVGPVQFNITGLVPVWIIFNWFGPVREMTDRAEHYTIHIFACAIFFFRY